MSATVRLTLIRELPIQLDGQLRAGRKELESLRSSYMLMGSTSNSSS